MSIARFQHVSEDRYALDALHGSLSLADIPLPRRATAGSAGYDFVCTADVTLQPGESLVIPTGIRCEMASGWVLMLFPRSSLGFKHNVRLSNTVGVIDSDYFHAANEGHIMVKLYNAGDHAVTLARGDRFCQGVFLPYGVAEEDGELSDRSGGLGSTGR